MPPGVALTSIGDLVDHSLPHFLDQGDFTQVIAQRSFHFFNTAFRKDRKMVQSGNSIEWRLIFGNKGSARHARLMQPRERNMIDKLSKGTQRWVMADAEILYHEQLMDMTKSKAELVEYMKAQTIPELTDLAVLLEQRALSPVDSASDDVNPDGLPSWICKLNAAVEDPEGQFGGQTIRRGDGSTTTTIGNIDRSTVTLARNWAATHAGMGKPCLESLRRGLLNVKYERPYTVEEMLKGRATDWRAFMGINMLAEYENIVNAGGDNRNGDYSPFHGQGITLFGMRPIAHELLDEDADEPIYVVDFANFRPVVLDGWWMKSKKARELENPAHVWMKRIDCQYNWICTDPRRAGLVVHRVASI